MDQRGLVSGGQYPPHVAVQPANIPAVVPPPAAPPNCFPTLLSCAQLAFPQWCPSRDAPNFPFGPSGTPKWHLRCGAPRCGDPNLHPPPYSGPSWCPHCAIPKWGGPNCPPLALLRRPRPLRPQLAPPLWCPQRVASLRATMPPIEILVPTLLGFLRP